MEDCLNHVPVRLGVVVADHCSGPVYPLLLSAALDGSPQPGGVHLLVRHNLGPTHPAETKD